MQRPEPFDIQGQEASLFKRWRCAGQRIHVRLWRSFFVLTLNVGLVY